MTYFLNTLPVTSIFLSILFLFGSNFASVSWAKGHKDSVYELSLSFVPEEGRLIGTAKITMQPGSKLSLLLEGLDITGTLLLDNESGRERRLRDLQNVLVLPAATTSRTLYLSYTKTIKEHFDNLISTKGISLTTNWYPLPEQPMLFHVRASLPDHFSAVMESDNFPLKQQDNIVSADFSRPLTNIHLIAGPYLMQKRLVRKGFYVYSMFFKEDQELADEYLKAAAGYLNRYEKEIGPFPYNHYVIVDNRLPTGLSMPTFTLLGQMVLRLPFIKNTSLGHEIVHSWFGNAVEVDYSQGNWCEGLTSFLADHAFREDKGEGVADRLESITRYLSYVHEDTAIPLADFTSAGHNQPMAEARRAVGYERGALLFYELREKIGDQAFRQGIRNFYTDNNGKYATWDDLRNSFESASGEDLKTFFLERLTRKYIPDLSVEDIRIEHGNDKIMLTFNLLQNSKKPFSLLVPIRIKTMAKTSSVICRITKAKERISIPLVRLPLEFTVDPEHAFLRQLTMEEFPAVWSRFLGSEKRLAILAKESERDLYRPFLDTLGENNLEITLASKVTNRELGEDSDLLFLGTKQAPSRALFGLPKYPDNGFTLDVHRNPLNRKHVAVLVSSSEKAQTLAIAGKINHYGKYSYVEFINGRNATKKIQNTVSGLDFVLEELPAGNTTSSLSSFNQIVDKLAGNRVVYVGEDHTSYADHLLQLRIIEALYSKNSRIAIGMEMFPSSSQPALDKYTLSDHAIDERTFLKESDYFNVWSFDYRYFQDILLFARKNHLPVIGLNLDRKIVSEVFRTGGTDSLDKKTQKLLPVDRNLDMPGYAERLSFVHDMHIQGSHGRGAESGFIQSQGIWDETMAKNIVSFLTARPDYRMVVLAGAEHTRKDSGIPPRVSRRLPIEQASVLNIYDGSTPDDLQQLADYYFLAAPEQLPEPPQIGIVLETESEGSRTYLKISRLSPHGKAKAAGLQEGDILQQVNGYPVSDMSDVRIAMLGTRIGDTIDVRIIRPKEGKDREHLYKVELTAPPISQPHP